MSGSTGSEGPNTLSSSLFFEVSLVSLMMGSIQVAASYFYN